MLVQLPVSITRSLAFVSPIASKIATPERLRDSNGMNLDPDLALMTDVGFELTLIIHSFSNVGKTPRFVILGRAMMQIDSRGTCGDAQTRLVILIAQTTHSIETWVASPPIPNTQKYIGRVKLVENGVDLFRT